VAEKLKNEKNERIRHIRFPSIPGLSKSIQAFTIALIIISAYVIFFGVVMFRAPPGEDGINYEGMKDLTATFGIIVAAVVGYYFGQKNYEEAAKTAETATDIAKQAKNEVEVKKTEAKVEKQNMIKEIRAAKPFYDDFEKLATSAAKQKNKPVGEIEEEQNLKLENLIPEIQKRKSHLNSILETKEKEVKAMESSKSEK
jgi:hypothetical protein